MPEDILAQVRPCSPVVFVCNVLVAATEMAMVATEPPSKAPRRTASPHDLAVSQIQEKLEQYFDKTGSRDMGSLLATMKKEVTWKNAPRAAVLAQYSSLFEGFADICPCGVLPPKRTAMALVCCHRSRPINYSGRSDAEWADDISALLRATFSKFRELAHDVAARRRCYNKAFANSYRDLCRIDKDKLARVRFTPPSLVYE